MKYFVSGERKKKKFVLDKKKRSGERKQKKNPP